MEDVADRLVRPSSDFGASAAAFARRVRALCLRMAGTAAAARALARPVPPASRLLPMRYNETMFNRQLGRNAQLFAREIGRMDTPEARHPYLRELLAVIEEARPEWAEAEHKASLYTHLLRELCGAVVGDDEIEAAVRAREAEAALATADLSFDADPSSDAQADARSADAG